MTADEAQNILDQKRREYRRKKAQELTETESHLRQRVKEGDLDAGSLQDLIERNQEIRLGDGEGMVALSDVAPAIAQRFYDLAKREPNERAEPPANPYNEPDCHTCGDTHYVSLGVQPQRDGTLKTVTEPCPDCWHEWFMRVVSEHWPVARLVEQLAQQPFIVMDFTEDAAELFPDADDPHKAAREAMRKQRYAKAVVERFCDVWPAGILVTFEGGYGRGKGHLLAKIWRRALEAGKTVILTSGPQLQRRLTDFEGDEVLTIEQYRRHLLTVDLVLVDEATRYAHKDGFGWFESQEYFDLINQRLEASKTTVLAGNDIEERLHGGIVSRADAGDSVRVRLHGVPDMRPVFERQSQGWMEGIEEAS